VSQVPSTTASTAALTYQAASNALQTAHTGAGTVLKIGFIGILSGQYKSYGVDEQYGAQLAIDKVNAAGGITVGGNTYTLTLDSQDDAADPTKGAQGASKLVDDKVVAVIGGTFSGATIAE
jgi:branched-chain amino acid transport system substrate-binding protein